MKPSLQTLLETALTLTQKRSHLHQEIETLRETLSQTDSLLEKTLQEALRTPLEGVPHPNLSPTPVQPDSNQKAPNPPLKPNKEEKPLKRPEGKAEGKSAGEEETKPEKKPARPPLQQKMPESHGTPTGLRDTKKQDMARQIETLLLENPEGLRVDQIAERTGRSQSNVYVWLTGRAHEYIAHLKKVGPGTWAIVK